MSSGQQRGPRSQAPCPHHHTLLIPSTIPLAIIHHKSDFGGHAIQGPSETLDQPDSEDRQAKEKSTRPTYPQNFRPTGSTTGKPSCGLLSSPLEGVSCCEEEVLRVERGPRRV